MGPLPDAQASLAVLPCCVSRLIGYPPATTTVLPTSPAVTPVAAPSLAEVARNVGILLALVRTCACALHVCVDAMAP